MHPTGMHSCFRKFSDKNHKITSKLSGFCQKCSMINNIINNINYVLNNDVNVFKNVINNIENIFKNVISNIIMSLIS